MTAEDGFQGFRAEFEPEIVDLVDDLLATRCPTWTSRSYASSRRPQWTQPTARTSMGSDS